MATWPTDWMSPLLFPGADLPWYCSPQPSGCRFSCGAQRVVGHHPPPRHHRRQGRLEPSATSLRAARLPHSKLLEAGTASIACFISLIGRVRPRSWPCSSETEKPPKPWFPLASTEGLLRVARHGTEISSSDPASSWMKLKRRLFSFKVGPDKSKVCRSNYPGGSVETCAQGQSCDIENFCPAVPFAESLSSAIIRTSGSWRYRLPSQPQQSSSILPEPAKLRYPSLQRTLPRTILFRRGFSTPLRVKR